MLPDSIYDDRLCELGEGPLWHPERKQLFWFDILNNRMLSRSGHKQFEWQFDRRVSAAGWVDKDTLLVAGAGALLIFDLATGRSEHLCDLEVEEPKNRSNDGRADPWGGFWIGTMGRKANARSGAIYRYYRGELRKLFSGITIPNAISFMPDGGHAYFADTRERILWRQALGRNGWPQGEPQVFLDARAAQLNFDGAVVDIEAHLWVALWGASQVARYTPDGELAHVAYIGTSQVSCPAFGGSKLNQLFVTTARDNLARSVPDAEPCAGATFMINVGIAGQVEHRLVL